MSLSVPPRLLLKPEMVQEFIILKCLPSTECLSKMLSLCFSSVLGVLLIVPLIAIPPEITLRRCRLFAGLLTILVIAAAVDCNCSILNYLADKGIRC